MYKKIISLFLCAAFFVSATCFVSAQQDDSPVIGTLKIVDFNVDGLPVPSFLSSSGKNVFTSADSIIGFLNEHSCDILMMQENFNLYKKYTDSLDMPYITASSGGAGVGDGLGIASKMPVYNVAHIPWDSAYGIFNAGSDELTPKGFLSVTLELGEGIYIDVYTLHADANEDENSLQAKREQFKQLSDYIDSHSKDRAVIIAGDFNSNFSIVLGDELRETFIDRGFKDTWVEACNGGNYNSTYDELYNKYQIHYWGHYDCLDKIFYRDGGGVNFDILSHDYEFCYTTSTSGETVIASDHAACIAELKYTVSETESSEFELLPEQGISFADKFKRFIKSLFNALKLIISQVPGLISGDIQPDWMK